MQPEDFVEACRACRAAGGTPHEVALIVRRALAALAAHPAAWETDALLHRADDLLIANVTLPPHAGSAAHEHATWAVIGVACGREVEHFFVERDGRLEPFGEVEVGPGETVVLAEDSIHAITNPLGQPARGLHVYGTDLHVTPRRMWDPRSGAPRAFELETFERWEQAITAARRERAQRSAAV
jgi:predicted metal-dependent enzyme (double-stranded beta helix superfamily)